MLNEIATGGCRCPRNESQCLEKCEAFGPLLPEFALQTRCSGAGGHDGGDSLRLNSPRLEGGEGFDLTQALTDEIVDALETQGKQFEVNGYPLPQWGSEEGFALREEFVRRLDFAAAKEAARSALHSGRGAFRTFKDTLKAYPAAERAWHRYKRRRMAEYVRQWYDGLCEEWGLEHLARGEENGENELLEEDFVFEDIEIANNAFEELAEIAFHSVREIASVATKEGRNRNDEELCYENARNGESVAAVWEALAKRWRVQCEADKDAGTLSLIVCRSNDGIGIGGAAWTADKDRGAAFLVCLYVAQEWRLLGIGNRLLNAAIEKVKVAGCSCIISQLPVMDEAAEALLKKMMFEKSAGVFWKRLD